MTTTTTAPTTRTHRAPPPPPPPLPAVRPQPAGSARLRLRLVAPSRQPTYVPSLAQRAGRSADRSVPERHGMGVRRPFADIW